MGREAASTSMLERLCDPGSAAPGNLPACDVMAGPTGDDPCLRRDPQGAGGRGERWSSASRRMIAIGPGGCSDLDAGEPLRPRERCSPGSLCACNVDGPGGEHDLNGSGNGTSTGPQICNPGSDVHLELLVPALWMAPVAAATSTGHSMSPGTKGCGWTSTVQPRERCSPGSLCACTADGLGGVHDLNRTHPPTLGTA